MKRRSAWPPRSRAALRSRAAPRWPDVGEELYSHVGDDGSDFDAFENANCNASEPHVATALRAVLHEAVANASRKAALWY